MRILHVVSVMDMGGMENYIMNLYRKVDRSKFQFDFLVHHGRRGIFEDEIEALGGRVYHTTLMDEMRRLKLFRMESIWTDSGLTKICARICAEGCD